MRKALKNIPKPDKDKLALFYGQEDKKPEEPLRTSAQEPDVATADRMSTVDKAATVDNEKLLKDAIKPLLSHGQQSVYMELVNRSRAIGQDVTGWIGYRKMAKETFLSIRTVQRAIEKLLQKRLLERIDFINTAEMKGSKYRVILPPGLEMATADKMSAVATTATVVKKEVCGQNEQGDNLTEEAP